MVNGMVWVLLGILEMKVMVVLNFFNEWVKESIVLVIIFGKESGNVMVKNICYGFVLRVCVVNFSWVLIVFSVRWIVLIINGKVIIVEVNVVLC